ncbi:MAG: helix-turn-helix transcriptional regulator [Erythrobacter sp.]|jgi:transcriptional regulator with XRE-family HTH domain|nr:helix-turn-helix transcriptional regulator [Erythrobacter sp.]
MINRIREIRRQKGLTLAELAEACDPPTTAQTIGRLETGMRNLSLKWMDRIGAALGVDPETLVRSGDEQRPRIRFELALGEVRTHAAPREIVLPHELARGPGGAEDRSAPMVVMEVAQGMGDYRGGDLVWLRELALDAAPATLAAAINRDCLVVRQSGRAVFGRLIDSAQRDGSVLVGVLPAESGHKQQVIENPRLIAVSEMLVRRL